MNTVGQHIKITFFGESHSKHMGLVIDDLKPGIEINHQLIRKNLEKRRPKARINTSRVEKDNYQIISGLSNNKTNGSPLTILIKNKEYNHDEYPNLNKTPRPSHADMPANIKYEGYNNYYGGGMFSGRLTVLWVIVGSIAQQLLEEKNIYTGSHIYSLHNIYDDPFDMNHIEKSHIIKLNNKSIALNNSDIEKQMMTLIEKTKNDKDSIGGVIEAATLNLPIGLGQPLFHSLESYLSYLLFSIPAIKGIEFGEGFKISEKFGSQVNDEYYYNKNKEIKTKTNYNGGILGGLSTGAPLIIRLAVKPIASIAKTQNTIDTEKLENTKISIKGRHDSQILSRISPIVNAVINYCIMDLMYKEL